MRFGLRFSHFEPTSSHMGHTPPGIRATKEVTLRQNTDGVSRGAFKIVKAAYKRENIRY